MPRPFILIAMISMAAAGCGLVAGPQDLTDPNATYTLKIKPKLKGEKFEVQDTIKSTFITRTGAYRDEPASVLNEPLDATLEFTEGILDSSEFAWLPLHLRRTFKTARCSEDSGKTIRPLRFEGKTIWIHREPSTYTYELEGEEILWVPEKHGDYLAEFGKKGEPTPDLLFPKEPVKINTPWELDSRAMRSISLRLKEFTIGVANSKGTGRLVRARKQDGAIWGEVEIKTDLEVVINFRGRTKFPVGVLQLSINYDMPIDGSSHQGTKVVQIHADASKPTATPYESLQLDYKLERKITLPK